MFLIGYKQVYILCKMCVCTQFALDTAVSERDFLEKKVSQENVLFSFSTYLVEWFLFLLFSSDSNEIL